MLALLDNPSRDQHIIAPPWSQLHLGNTRGWEGGVSQMIYLKSYSHLNHFLYPILALRAHAPSNQHHAAAEPQAANPNPKP